MRAMTPEDRYDDAKAVYGAEVDADNAEQVDMEIQAAIRRIEWALADAEGAYTVEGIYYANVDDAARMRRLAAERMARDGWRLDRYRAVA